MNPIDEALSDPHTAKLAGLGDMARSFVGGAQGALRPDQLGGEAMKGVIGAVAGAGALAAVPAAKKIWDSIQSRRVFKEMVQLAPELSHAQQQDPQTFHASYNAMRRLNPVFAGDPLVASALMKRMMDPSADAEGRMRTLVSTIKQPEAPKSQVMLNSKIGPFSFAHSI